MWNLSCRVSLFIMKVGLEFKSNYFINFLRRFPGFALCNPTAHNFLRHWCTHLTDCAHLENGRFSLMPSLICQGIAIFSWTSTVTLPFLMVLCTHNRYMENIFQGEKSWKVQVVVNNFKMLWNFGGRHWVWGDDVVVQFACIALQDSTIWNHFTERF